MEDQFAYLDDLINDAEAQAPTRGSKLNFAYIRGDSKFDIRLFQDANKRLVRIAWAYKCMIPALSTKAGEEGKLINRQFSALAKGPTDDTIKAITQELGLGWQANARCFYIYYAELSNISKGKDEQYFKPGPCIFIANKRFHDALLIALKNLRGKKPEFLANALDPTKDGLVMNVNIQGAGRDQIVAVGFDTISDLGKAQEKEIAEAFKDISVEYLPNGQQNDVNYDIILNHYKSTLKEKVDSVAPVSATHPLDKPVNQVAETSATPPSMGSAPVKETHTEPVEPVAPVMGDAASQFENMVKAAKN